MKNVSRFNAEKQLVLAEILEQGILFNKDIRYGCDPLLYLYLENQTVQVASLLGLFALGLTKNYADALSLCNEDGKLLALALGLSKTELEALQMYGGLLDSIEAVKLFIQELRKGESSI